jgi:lipopolysaccharide transport system ATP-binding protein
MKTPKIQRPLAIKLRNVGVSYKIRSTLFKTSKYWALKDVSFDLYHGETLGVVGRNGVGKSTLLRLLAGIISPDKGEVINEGVTSSLLSLQVGFIPHLTGRENAILSGMMLGLSKAKILSLMDDICDYCDIGDFFDQPVRGYSSGMRARLGFSVAYYSEPDVLLIDEVLGVGDADFKIKSSEALKKRIMSDETVVIVSHNVNTLRELCDRVIWIENGIKCMEGSASNVLDEFVRYKGKFENIRKINHKP